MQDEFLGGVVEGFYGRTWTHAQRLDLFSHLPEWGLNTYFYSPKDDLKHRAAWRETYDDSELAPMRELVSDCRNRGLHFIYGLSPGLDIRFSDPDEHQAIRHRLEQMIALGVQHFALLFDDLPGNMTDRDRAAFPSVAAAQAHVANETFAWLRGKILHSRMLFCPTPYCDRMVGWKLGGEDYLDVIGDSLDAPIDILWTGSEIISRDINAESLRPIIQRIKRKPVIWDNLHANDYDLRRHFCGPYTRSRDVKDHVRGVLSNPNNEYPLNYITLRTLGEYLVRDDYDPRQAYLAAAQDWAAHYETINGRVAEQDVILISDCYYLPYEDGETAVALKGCVDALLHQPVDAWGRQYEEFCDYHRRITHVFEQLTQLRNRELFYAWSRRIWELREELDLIKDFVDAKKSGALPADGFVSETHLPFTCRGGMVADLQRKLVMDRRKWRVR